MRIGIVGGGNIGATAARLFAAAGHEVAVANSRGPETLAGLVDELGDGARAETVESAAEFGERSSSSRSHSSATRTCPPRNSPARS
jgi:8-hydroxy-5-deazaflavin:NADPH oxidoreductase